MSWSEETGLLSVFASDRRAPPHPFRSMPLLHIALQEGFNGDDVVLEVGGREVFRQSGVKTRTQIGLAASHELQVPNGATEVRISLPKRSLNATVSVDVTEDIYLGFSVSPEGKLQHVVSKEPFGYV